MQYPTVCPIPPPGKQYPFGPREHSASVAQGVGTTPTGSVPTLPSPAFPSPLCPPAPASPPSFGGSAQPVATARCTYWPVHSKRLADSGRSSGQPRKAGSVGGVGGGVGSDSALHAMLAPLIARISIRRKRSTSRSPLRIVLPLTVSKA